jgi:uncharacterized protein (DUF362 family)
MKKKCKIKLAKVAVVRCNSYAQGKVNKAVSKALELINYKFKKGMTVLIKPNILGSYTPRRQKAITTNPALVEAVCKILKKNKCKIYIGESSFMNTNVAFKTSGIEKVAKKYTINKKPIIFEQEKLRYIKDSSAKILKKFPIARIIKQVDLVINMPKMKTHSLAHVTLGIKNLYGLIPGGLKQRIHTKARGDRFSEILVDIYQNIKPELNILDGIIGMDGHGPASGRTQRANVIMASENTIALDIAASSFMEFKPRDVPAIEFAVKRGLYPNYKFELLGASKLPTVHFRKPMKGKTISRVRKQKEKPIVCDIKKCIKCGTCAKKCPVNAITLKPYPEIDKRKCIRCFCCMEVCPVHALSLGKEE